MKLLGPEYFHVGIAAQFKQTNSNISKYDKHAILYDSECTPPVIRFGSNEIHSNLTRHKTGDVIRFTFKPHTRKLVINLVRS